MATKDSNKMANHMTGMSFTIPAKWKHSVLTLSAGKVSSSLNLTNGGPVSGTHAKDSVSSKVNGTNGANGH